MQATNDGAAQAESQDQAKHGKHKAHLISQLDEQVGALPQVGAAEHTGADRYATIGLAAPLVAGETARQTAEAPTDDPECDDAGCSQQHLYEDRRGQILAKQRGELDDQPAGQGPASRRRARRRRTRLSATRPTNVRTA